MFRGLCHDVYDQAETSGHNLREPSKDPAVDVAKPWNETQRPTFQDLVKVLFTDNGFEPYGMDLYVTRVLSATWIRPIRVDKMW
jgi:hypothetical protein